ncbi:TLD-domain-containing protein [Dichotomocladium elegans]|nr:TLD-domain-containing protein [Dichotomocladium elegans]
MKKKGKFVYFTLSIHLLPPLSFCCTYAEMTKQHQYHLSWSPAATVYHSKNHQTYSMATSAAGEHNPSMAGPSSPAKHSQIYYPLQRSVTDEESYADKPSPITRFVSKLLGLGASPTSTANKQRPCLSQRQRPPLVHKSHSTTSITKDSSVISSPSSLSSHHDDRSPVTSVAVFDWRTQHHNTTDSICSNNSITTTTSKSSSTISSITSSPSKRTASPPSTCTNCSPPTSTDSAAVDALISVASLLEEQQEKPQTQQRRVIEFLDVMEPPKLMGRRLDTEPVLDDLIAEQIRSYLPRRYRLASSWSLVYSLDQHGSSMSTMYRVAKRCKEGPCVLAIKDENDSIFGAFLNESIKGYHTSYYGNGECFLWKYSRKNGTIKVFPWTGKNEYMVLSESDFIAIGGGDGKFGLWINSDLEKGHSEPCPTFDNETLSLFPEFECIEIELFSIGEK